MNPYLFDILLGLSSFAIQRVDKKIDEDHEQEELARTIRENLENTFGDIPLLNDEEEIEKIKEGVKIIHKGLQTIISIIDKE